MSEEHKESGESEELKSTGEKLWDVTRKTFHNATFQANRYKRLVQKKVDVAALHKKIAAAHTDLGKLIDDRRGAGASDLLGAEEVQALFQKLDGLKQAAATLEEEIESIRAEAPAEETQQPPPEAH